MGDSTSAKVFGEMFEILARDPSDANKKIAAELWGKTQEYDFCDDELCCTTGDLVTLGLATLTADPEWPDGQMVIYGPVTPSPTPVGAG